MKTFEVITSDGKSHYVSANTKKEVIGFWVSQKPKKVILRIDIDTKENLTII